MTKDITEKRLASLMCLRSGSDTGQGVARKIMAAVSIA
jgi:hypothetical protein